MNHSISNKDDSFSSSTERQEKKEENDGSFVSIQCLAFEKYTIHSIGGNDTQHKCIVIHARVLNKYFSESI
ncbi:unnamed protein product [Rotaria magnacalcarata]